MAAEIASSAVMSSLRSARASKMGFTFSSCVNSAASRDNLDRGSARVNTGALGTRHYGGPGGRAGQATFSEGGGGRWEEREGGGRGSEGGRREGRTGRESRRMVKRERERSEREGE